MLRDTADPEVAREVENVVWKLERQIKEEARQNMVSSLGDGSDNVVKNLNSISAELMKSNLVCSP